MSPNFHPHDLPAPYGAGEGKYTNHLSAEKSPYLLQHAHNPVDWYPWGEEAFEKSRREQKPVLLSIGYSTCHWCHVMAHESFEDEDIAAVVNAHFVAVKVDREERPDIDHIYMNAVVAMTAQGGWPLTVFLTPQAQPFYGGTYFPPYPKWGAPGFKDVLHAMAAAWNNNRQDILSSAGELTAVLNKQVQAGPAHEAPLDAGVLDTAFRHLSSQFDRHNGGFGSAPKFPMGHTLSFLLRVYKNSGQAQALAMAEKTLSAMALGGIYDHLGGGFHRYSTDQRWHVPHFEKMLYDQALLVQAYAEAYQITGNFLYARIAQETLDYVLRDMTSPEGGFYCAQDADSEGMEGAFYVWGQKEISGILTTEEAGLFDRYYGVVPDGNVGADPQGEFTGKNILFLAGDIAAEHQDGLAKARRKLFAFRQLRPRPHLDDKILTDWNGLMIAAFAFAGCVFGQPRYIDAARKAADFVLARLKAKGRLTHRFAGGEAAVEGMLEDYAFFLWGLAQVYEATFEDHYLNQAVELADRMVQLFSDDAGGGFFMTSADAKDLIVRPQDIYDGALPSGNSVAAFALGKLHYLTQKKEYLRHSQGVLKRFMPAVAQAPHSYAFFCLSLDFHGHPPVEITVQGALDQSTIANIRKVVYKYFIPGRVFKHQLGPGALRCSVCRQGTCFPPTADMASLEKMMSE
ncbi:MAG: thioredoxin domain-containing protein [Candidatus Omnitrophica bacterium]|nr:thioredoxin domain-containing protein [Candidatus Omnitrophota bacterium]